MGDFDFLFARPSFLEGLARTIDVGGTLQEYNRCVTPEQADACAILNDWRAVGNDMRKVLSEGSSDHR